MVKRILFNFRILKFHLTFLIIFLFAGQVFSQSYSGGSGTSQDPWRISTPQDLSDVRLNPGAWFIQTENIDMNGISFAPLGGGGTGVIFSGSYDGQGYIISNLTIFNISLNNVGLFGETSGAVISNVVLTNVAVAGNNIVGGLVGLNSGNSVISNCLVDGTVTGSGDVGGLAGSNAGSVIRLSQSKTIVTGSNSGSNTGGIAGYNSGTIEISYSEGNVGGNNLVGGLVGNHDRDQAAITSCYSRAAVTGNTDIGGLVGSVFQGNVSGSYSTGRVTGTSRTGGLNGRIRGGGLVNNSFWDTETSGQTGSAGGTGLLTDDMKNVTTFTSAGWDFTDLWMIEPSINDGYPFFPWRWNGSAGSNWHTGGSWNRGVVPFDRDLIHIQSSANDPEISFANVSVNNLAIQENAGMVVSIGIILSVRPGGELIVNNNASLTVEPGGSLTSSGLLTNLAGAEGLVVRSADYGSGSLIHNNGGVPATIERWVTGNEWHIVSSPVENMTVEDFLVNSGNQVLYNTNNQVYAMTNYDESIGSNGSWSGYYGEAMFSTMLQPGRSYLIRTRADGVLTFRGNIMHEVPAIGLSRTVSGWHSIGNPFASALKVRGNDGFITHNAVTFSGIDPNYAALYIWDPSKPGKYSIITNSNPVSPDREIIDQDHIQPGQGFLVKAAEGGGSVEFTASTKTHEHSSARFFKSSASGYWPTLILSVRDNTKVASTTITFHENMTRGLDVTYDVGLLGGDQGFRLYTRLAEDDRGIDFTIQCLPDYGFNDIVIPIGFDFAAGGEVKFTADHIDLPPGAKAYLEDRHLGVFTDLSVENYTVELNENSTGAGRFFLLTDYQITGIDDQLPEQENSLHIYSYGKEVFIKGPVEQNTQAEAYDIMGRRIKTIELQPSDMNSFTMDSYTGGTYLIRVNGVNIQQIKRLYIQ